MWNQRPTWRCPATCAGRRPVIPGGSVSGVTQPINTHFRRCQVNTHGVQHDFHARLLRETVRQMTVNGQQVIFQYDNVNTDTRAWISASRPCTISRNYPLGGVTKVENQRGGRASSSP